MAADDYLGEFIITAGKVAFGTSDGRRWRMRQPTVEQAADGDSAYRIAYQRVMDDKRLADLAETEDALKREARIRGAGAEAAYLIPLLLENESGGLAFDVFNDDSMAEFEALPPEVIAEMTTVYFGLISQAVDDAKKKSRKGSQTN